MAFRFVDHTADLAVEIDSPSLDALFEDAAAAFRQGLVRDSPVEPRSERGVRLKASDLERLMVRWLGESLVAFDVDGFLAASSRVAIEPVEGGFSLVGSLIGEACDSARHAIAVLIKGVSYHGLAVERAGDRWRATIVFDI